MKEVKIEKRKKNYTIGNIGNFNELKEYSYMHPMANIAIPGKVFLGEELNMSSMEISFQVLEKGKEIPFSHKHKTHEEVYVIIKGQGEFIVDDEATPIKEGSVIRVEPEGNRTWRNNSNDDLIIMVIQAVDGSIKEFTVHDGYVDKK